jgi:hypothetical protein
LHDAVCWHLLATFSHSLLVLLFHCCTNGRHSTKKNLLGDGTLSFWEFCKNGIDVDATWLNALWLRTLWEFRWSLEERTTWTVSATFSTFTTLVTITALTAWLVTVTTWSAALIAIATTLLTKLLRHCFKRLI